MGATDDWTDWTECTDSASTLTTSQPSIDSEVDDESEDETKLALRFTLDVSAAPASDFDWPCSRSFSLPFSPLNSLLTPKLSLRFSDLLGYGGAEKLLSAIASLSLPPSAFESDSVMLLASAIGSLKNPDAFGDSGEPGGLAGSGLWFFGLRMSSSDLERDMPFPLATDDSR